MCKNLNKKKENNMAKTKTIFSSSDVSEYSSEMRCYTNMDGEIFIQIKTEGNSEWIALDIDTAEKLQEVLDAEIIIAKEAQDVIKKANDLECQSKNSKRK